MLYNHADEFLLEKIIENTGLTAEYAREVIRSMLEATDLEREGLLLVRNAQDENAAVDIEMADPALVLVKLNLQFRRWVSF